MSYELANAERCFEESAEPMMSYKLKYLIILCGLASLRENLSEVSGFCKLITVDR
ncbi:hypothetical protein GGR21_002390 [Dysgonomonas hofstadii]|uniref:Uncharacterized protein n=1 Tax=Dysgonomonas hofstadii TaxID=637886 RepID=A0A840CQT6_9BACT|nr:hypothetical protein [Dysgonomonas hofstadii]MBB4036488.1 hypothetical protein [Dysgonomonas hofstadii]